ncbi:MAG: DUF2752 domain-containing protein [Actinobacteria bacterium]|nr:DUF2752 domain-containing protein [Actinomycetota bacterium]
MSTSLLVRWRGLSLPSRVALFLLSALAIREVSLRTEGFQSGPVLCIFRNLTGLPCPFCGSTRSVGQILQGDFIEALAFNPIGFLVAALIVIMTVAPATMERGSQTLSRLWERLSNRTQVISVIMAISLLWALNLPRLI